MLSCLPPGQLLIDALQAPLHRESEVESRRSTMPARAVKLRAAGYSTPMQFRLRWVHPNARVAGQPLEERLVSTMTFAETRYGIEMVDDPIHRAELNDWLAHRVRSVFDQRVLEVSEMSCPSGACASRMGVRRAIRFRCLT
ncbi:MAG: hypothetical protein V5A91_01660 [Candidatus Accumulibacter necessarius]|jgi:hypothetical protein